MSDIKQKMRNKFMKEHPDFETKKISCSRFEITPKQVQYIINNYGKMSQQKIFRDIGLQSGYSTRICKHLLKRGLITKPEKKSLEELLDEIITTLNK